MELIKVQLETKPHTVALSGLPWQVGSLPLSHLGIPLIHQVHLKSPQEGFLPPPDQ